MAIPMQAPAVQASQYSGSPGQPGPTFDVFLGDLRTGRVFTRLDEVSGTWQQSPINDAGTMSVIVKASSMNAQFLDLYHTGATARAFLAIGYDQTILNAGPIWTSHYQRSTGQFTLNASGLFSLFDHRMVIPLLKEPFPTSPPGAAGTVQSSSGATTYPTTSNMSLGDIAKALVQQACTHVGGNLPLLYPAAQGLTPGATRTYNGYELKTLADMLKELAAVEGGPEIRFVPSYTDQTRTAIQWTMLTGTPAQPLLAQSGADWFFDMSVPATPVVDVEYSVDATMMATRTWATGAGSSDTLLMAQADSTALTAAGYPLLEVQQAFSNVSVQATLDSHAQQLSATNNRPSAIWKLTTRDDGGLADGSLGVAPSPRLGEYGPGDWCQIVTGTADPFLPQGQRRARINLVEGDFTYQHTVTCFGENAEV